MDFVKKSTFVLSLFFYKNYVTKRSFFDIYERKESFLDQNIEVLKRAKK